MAADIVSYSRLIESDEANTLAAIKDLRREVIDPLLAERHGRIVKLMGDGATVEFGSVVDAVACAVAIQKGVAERQADMSPERRIVFRIGINLGDVVVEDDDLLGDGVNVAARLEQLCAPGGVLVSGTAYDHLQGRLGLPLEFVGEKRVKNIERPVRASMVRRHARCAGLSFQVGWWRLRSASCCWWRESVGGGIRRNKHVKKPRGLCPSHPRLQSCRFRTSRTRDSLADLPTAWRRTSLRTSPLRAF